MVSSFERGSDSELTVQKGDIVTVVTTSDDGWWRVRGPNMEEGLIPSVCLKDMESTNQISDYSLGTKPILEEFVGESNST